MKNNVRLVSCGQTANRTSNAKWCQRHGADDFGERTKNAPSVYSKFIWKKVVPKHAMLTTCGSGRTKGKYPDEIRTSLSARCEAVLVRDSAKDRSSFEACKLCILRLPFPFSVYLNRFSVRSARCPPSAAFPPTDRRANIPFARSPLNAFGSGIIFIWRAQKGTRSADNLA